MELYIGVLSLVALISAIWVIYDVLANQRRMKDITRIVWIIAALIFSIITAIIYYLVEKK